LSIKLAIMSFAKTDDVEDVTESFAPEEEEDEGEEEDEEEENSEDVADVMSCETVAMRLVFLSV